MSNMLPNNLADWPPGKPLQVANSGSRQMVGRVAARLVLLILLGGLLGLGAYRWAVSLEDGASPSPVLLATPPRADAAPTPDDAESRSADAPAPELVVTSLLGNQAQSQNWAGYAATEGRYTGVSATWTVPDIGLTSPAGIDAAWVGIGG